MLMKPAPHILENLDQAGLLNQLLPLRSLAVRLQFIGESQPRFFHQAALSALLRHLLLNAKNFSRYLTVDTPESARLQYQAGDHYCFSIICVAGGEPLLAELMGALQQLPKSAPGKNPKESFGSNLRWKSFSCNLCDHPVEVLEDLGCYGMEQLAQETALWAEHHSCFHWQWLTPVRLLKEKTDRSEKGEARYCADAGDLSPALLMARLYDSVNALLKERGDQSLPPRPAPPSLSLEAQHCFWLDCSYQDKHQTEHAMGGLLGEFTYSALTPLPPPWAHFLVLGQYLGIGQRRSFGLGRYQLVTPDNSVTCRRQLAAKSLLTMALEESNLLEAFEHKTQKKVSARDPEYKWQQQVREFDAVPQEGDDHKHLDAGSEGELPPGLLKRAKALADGSYQVPPLRGVLIPKNNGEWRALAIAPFFDAVLQRAAAQVLAPSLDRVMDNRSFGYRRGRSRLGLKEQIQLAYRNGARWVLEADIDDFFDSVSFELVAQRLRALFHQDPINDAIIAWLNAPVDYDGLRLERKAGLPQGSPLSPVLANLLLDDFDSDMRKAGFNCLRFADDFVVVCKTREQAEQASARAANSLSEHGLYLAENKTRVTSFERGFRFLGYLFVNELALDVGSKALKEHERYKTHGSHKPAPSGWLADFLAQRPDGAPLTSSIQQLKNTEFPRLPSSQQAIALGDRENDGTFVCISGAATIISTEHGRLLVQRDDETVMSVPWQGLRSVLLLGRHHLTSPAISAALDQGVAIYFATRGGQYQGLLDSHLPRMGPRLWLLQEERSSDPEACLAVAKSLTTARIRHQREVLRQRALGSWQKLGDCLKQVEDCKELNVLQGVEGNAARQYFESIATGIDPQWGFQGRNRRPPKDPLNALLSLGFTLLYAHTETLLIVDGLNPRAGFYHKPHGRHSTLASDMMEPFRHLVERCALSFLNSGNVKTSDFTAKPNGGCELKSDARRKYLQRLSERFETPLKGRDGYEGKLVQLLRWQNRSLIDLIRAKGPFTAWLQR